MKAPNVVSALAARPALLASLAAALAAFVALSFCPLSWSARAIGAIDVGLVGYLGSAVWALRRSHSPDQMAEKAERMDEGRHAILLVSLLVVVLAILAVVLEIPEAKSEEGWMRGLRVGFVFVTLILSWLFLHTSFAFHYTHEFYASDVEDGSRGAPGLRDDGRRGGLIFPGGDPTPDYWDFIHFAYVIGVANQTADVQIESRAIRRLVTVQGVAAFVFNTVILALSVNLASSFL